MPGALLTLLLAGLVVLAVSGNPRAMVASLATMWLLVPGAARFPGTGSSHLLVQRVIVAAVVIGLARAFLLGRADRRVLALRGTHLAFVGFLAVTLLTGVVLAEPRIPTSTNANTYAALFEQGIFFTVALAVFRLAGARRSALIVTAVAGVLAAIAISEGMFSWSYSRWITKDLADPSGLLSLDLRTRGPNQRVRAAATFALELGWIIALLLPLTVATALAARGRARLLLAVPGALLVAMVWTWSRSTYAGLAVGLAVLALGVVVDQPRRAAPLAFVGLVLGGVLLQGPLRTTLDLGQTQGEQDVRFQRLPELLDLASERPIGGLGLGGLLVRRFTAVDLSWVNSYATVGVVGVVALAVLLLTAAHAASRFLLAGPGPTRLVAAGAAAGVVVAPVGMAAYDLLSLRSSTSTVWALAALSMAAGEELGVLPVPMRRRAELIPRPAFALGVLGLAGGLVLAATVPTVHSVDATFTTVAPRVLAVAGRDNPYTGKVLGQTGCLVLEPVRGIDVSCLDLDQVAGGVGELRVEASSADAAWQDFLEVRDLVLRTFPRAVVAVAERGSGRPTWATTAPIWLLATGFVIGALLPDRAYRRPILGWGPAERAGAAP